MYCLKIYVLDVNKLEAGFCRKNKYLPHHLVALTENAYQYP